MTIQQVIKHADNEIENGIALRVTLDDETYKELVDESIQRWSIIKEALEYLLADSCEGCRSEHDNKVPCGYCKRNRKNITDDLYTRKNGLE